jgi:hypothetical protein
MADLYGMHAMADGTELPYIDDGSGQKRILAALDPRPDFGGLMQWSAAQPVIPRSEWRDVSFGTDIKITNQGSHGCHDEATEVLTETGWKAWPDYNGTDCLGTMNPATGHLEFQAPLARQVYDYDGPLYYSENKSIDFALTPNHRMFVRPWNERIRTLEDGFVFREAKDLGWYCGLPHATTGFLGIDLKTVRVGSGPEMSGDDFLALIALVISDGWAGKTENTRNRVGFCCFRDDRLLMVRELAHRLGIAEASHRPGTWSWHAPELAEWFRVNAYTRPDGGARSKCVPLVVKTVCQRQVEHFLKFFGDQRHTVYERHGVPEGRNFYSSSYRMIDDLQELLLRVGKRGTISEREPRSTKMKDGREIHAENCGTEYILVERQADKLSLERKKNLVTEHYKGPVFCATVPNSLLVTRRNKSVLVSGNSCVGHGSWGGFTAAWYQGGGTRLEFSPVYVYGCINGGRDGGAIVSDSMDSLVNRGICLESTVPEGQIYHSRYPKDADTEAQRFRAGRVLHTSTFDEMGSALQLFKPVVFGITIGNGFNNLNDEGVCGFGFGIGGHCLFARGMKKLKSGQWAFLVQNSWGPGWGQKGNCYLVERHFPGRSDSYAIESVLEDPQETRVPNLV